MTRYTCAFLCISVLGAAACGDSGDDPEVPAVSKQDVVDNYGELVFRSYADALEKAVALKRSVDAFVAAPTPASHEAAKRAWLEARYAYGQTEAYRFYGGPIDDEDGPEGQINAWPMDEVYVDYVEGAPDAGIVNDTSIEITKANLSALNEGGMGDVTGIGGTFDEEKAISTGYHAIEFLLWGQDLSVEGPGQRPHTDYLVGEEATAPNGDRRGLYLQVATELLVDDLQSLVDEWALDGAFRTAFVAQDPNVALTKMLTGAGVLSKGELAAERMDVALETLAQEDEHSCFSDNTHIDFLTNALGIQNVWLGRYAWHNGPGVRDLVLAADPELAARVDAAMVDTMDAINAIPAPFDQAIQSQGSPGWNQTNTAVNALFDQADLLVEAGLAIGLDNVSVDLPE